MRKLSKVTVAIGATAAVLGTAGVAYAYWTTSGSGSGTGSVSPSNGSIDITGSVPTAIAPGQTRTITLYGTNSSATDSRVGVIHTAVTTTDADCTVSDITVNDLLSSPVVPHNTALANKVTLGTVTLTYANDPVNNQDGCKNAALALAFTTDTTGTSGTTP
jgi:hypothetical protein